jgi:hypothetical protein
MSTSLNRLVYRYRLPLRSHVVARTYGKQAELRGAGQSSLLMATDRRTRECLVWPLCGVESIPVLRYIDVDHPYLL